MYSLIKYIFKQKWSKTENEDYSDAGDKEHNTMESFKKAPVKKKSIAAQMPKDDEVEQLRKVRPHMFFTNHRNVPGIIVNIDENSIVVDVNFKHFIIDATTIITEIVQEVGDRVNVRCHIEKEELFSGEIIESLEPVALLPTLRKKNQKCIVKEILDDFVVLSNDCYISKSVLKKCGDPKLNVGENLFIDMIECNVNNFKWRCIYFSSFQNSELTNLMRVPKRSHNNSAQQKKTEETPRQRLVLPSPTGKWSLYQAKLGEYANQVWSQEVGEIFPGSSKCTQRRFKPVKIPRYEVPFEIRITYLSQCSTPKICRNTIGRCYPVLREDLSFDNYLERFQLLIWLEEIELYKNFRLYDVERVQFQRETEYICLTIPNLGERRPSLVIGDKVHARPVDNVTKDDSATTSKDTCFEGIIQMVLADKIYLKFHDIFHSTYDGESYRLEFFFSRVNFRRKHFAIFRAYENLEKNFLFPDKVYLHDRPQLDLRMDTINWHNKILNPLQRAAVFNILRGEAANMPYIIYGPPGTGKTMTLVECILQLVTNLPYSRLLVATPSNSAANLICTRLIESQGLHRGEMVRLVSYNLIERDQIPEDILPYCATADMGEDGTYEEEMYVTEEGIQMNCPKRLLAHYRVTIGTCSTLGKYLELGFNNDQFTHVLVDEAGQCTEPDIMVPLCQRAKNQGRVILAGDPMQLTAVVVNKYANLCGLSLSFLERLMNTQPYKKDTFNLDQSSGYNPILITKLCENYRSLPSILRIYNYLFYDFELLPTVCMSESPEAELLKKLNKEVLFKSDKRSLSHGAFFYEVRGENVREKDSPSWCNPREANIVFSTTMLLYRAGLQPEDIGIITPYTKQARFIRSLFKKSNLLNPKIGSVEEFQGQERNVILLSTVRTSRREILNYDLKQGLGFVKSERRLNVAISRARALLIVFGDSSLLRTDAYWSVYVKDCMDNNSYLGLKPIKADDDDSDIFEDAEATEVLPT